MPEDQAKWLAWVINQNISKCAFLNKDIFLEPEDLITATYFALKEVRSKYVTYKGIKLTTYTMFIVKLRLLDYVRQARRKSEKNHIKRRSFYSEEYLDGVEYDLEIFSFSQYQSSKITREIIEMINEYIESIEDETHKKALIYLCMGESKYKICEILSIKRRDLERYRIKLKKYLISLINGSSNI